jgi:hypothetical protein
LPVSGFSSILGALMTEEARSFGHRFFVALGYRKA